MARTKQAKPYAFHLIDSKNRFTKADLAARRDAEVKLGSHNFKTPSVILQNPEALKKWKWLLRLYKDAGFGLVTTGDKAILERYCLTWADYRRLRGTIAAVEQLYLWDDTGVLYWEAYNSLKLETHLYKVMAELTRLEEKLFLTPASKARTVAATAKNKPETPLEAKGFGNV